MSGKRVLCSVLSWSNVSRTPTNSLTLHKFKQVLSIDCRALSTNQANYCGKFVTEHSELVSQDQANDLIRRLRRDEIHLLKTAIQHYDSHPEEVEFQGQSSNNAEDPSNSTDSARNLPKDWWRKKCAASTPKPTSRQLIQLSVVNGLPFIGFGFLDNFIMILCGDWIEQTLNGYMCLSTMAAAGLGNTISDVFGIQSASYVERFTEHLGFRAPPLTQFQFSMKSSRRAANLGRILGITIGCLIGMTPLMFMDTDKDKKKKEEEAAKKAATATLALN